MSPQVVKDSKVWCPLCNTYVQILKISYAAQLAEVDRRSIYRYIEEGKVYAVKIAGSCYRICSSCLIQPDVPPPSKFQ